MHDLNSKALHHAFDEAMRALQGVRIATAHPLGFLIVDQVTDESGGYSRLHLWERARIRPEIPHSHSGDLGSTILAGSLANTPWQPSGDGTAVSIVAVKKNIRSVRRYQRLGLGSFEAGVSQSFRAGESYFIPAGEFHSSECISTLAITLVKRAPSLDQPARIAMAKNLSLSGRRRVVIPAELRGDALTLLRAERDRLGL